MLWRGLQSNLYRSILQTEMSQNIPQVNIHLENVTALSCQCAQVVLHAIHPCSVCCIPACPIVQAAGAAGGGGPGAPGDLPPLLLPGHPLPRLPHSLLPTLPALHTAFGTGEKTK